MGEPGDPPHDTRITYPLTLTDCFLVLCGVVWCGMGESGGGGPEPLLFVQAKGTRARAAGTGNSSGPVNAAASGSGFGYGGGSHSATSSAAENPRQPPSGQGLGQRLLGMGGLEVCPQMTAYDVRMCDVKVHCPPPPPPPSSSIAPPPPPCPGPPYNLLAPTRTTGTIGSSDTGAVAQVPVPVPPPPPIAAADAVATTTSGSNSTVGCLIASSKASDAGQGPAMVHRLLLRRVKCNADDDTGAAGGGAGAGSSAGAGAGAAGGGRNDDNIITWTTTTVAPCATSSHPRARASSTTFPCTSALRGRYRWVAEVVTSSSGHVIQLASPRPMVRDKTPTTGPDPTDSLMKLYISQSV